MQTRAWIYFWLVGLIWGSSFLLIRIGVGELHPFHVVMIRTGIAATGLSLVIIARRRKIPRDRRTILSLIAVGIGNVAIPFSLISMGETQIDSGIASVLQATAALFALVVAHFAFEDERITRKKVAGLLAGFAGVVVLASRSWAGGTVITAGLLGQLAIVAASLFYASFTTLGRKMIQRDVEPIVVAAISMLSAAITEDVLVLVTSPLGTPLSIPPTITPQVLIAVILLGLVNTFVAYLFYYSIVATLGVSRAAMVTYIVPVVGLILGVLLLNEVVDLKVILGAGLIFAGIGIVNLRAGMLLRRQRFPAARPVE